MSTPVRILTFFLTETDERRSEEITLAGVIDAKIARGDYEEEHVGSAPPASQG